MSVPMNILCQSPISTGMSPAEAIRNTVDLAQRAEALGYHRFWVAEQFNTLGALFPGRIDLGMGRSGGSEGDAPKALGMRHTGPGAFGAMEEVLRWLGPEQNNPLPNTFASPAVDGQVQPWILGTSPSSAQFAAERGLPYAFGGFLDPRGLQSSLAAYHQHFRPNRTGNGPRTMLAWNVVVAPTDDEAAHLARSTEHWFVRTMLRGENPPFEDPATLTNASYAPMEQMMLQMMRQMALIGSPERVLEGLHTLASGMHVDELTLVTIPYAHEARVASYELLMKAAA